MTMPIVGNLKEKVKNNFLKYAAALLIPSAKKTYTTIAKIFDISHDTIRNTFDLPDGIIQGIQSQLITLIDTLSKEKKGWLIVDDTLISKMFSKIIEGTDFHFDPAEKTYKKGLSTVVLAWANGETTIPLDFQFWLSKDVMKNLYQTKIQLAITLIEKYYELLDVKGVILDGLYATKEMMGFLIKNNIKFEMRMASNRVIEINSKCVPLKKSKELKLKRNERSKTIKAFWHGMELYFTAEKRKGKNGEWTVVFLVSNISDTAKNHIAIYFIRWEIEKFFRTAKQNLGIQDCAARSYSRQKAHVYSVFYSYAFLQNQKYLLKLPNVETIIKELSIIKSSCVLERISSFGQIFHSFA